RERACALRRVDDLEAIAQPLHGRTRNEDGAFERIGPLAVQLISNGGEEAVAREDGLRSRIEEREAAGAISRVDHARREASLPYRCRLLIAGYAHDRDGPPEKRGLCCAKRTRRVTHFGQ